MSDPEEVANIAAKSLWANHDELTQLRSQLAAWKEKAEFLAGRVSTLERELNPLREIPKLCNKYNEQLAVLELRNSELEKSVACLEQTETFLSNKLAASEARCERLKAVAQTLMDDSSWPNGAKDGVKRILSESPTDALTANQKDKHEHKRHKIEDQKS